MPNKSKGMRKHPVIFPLGTHTAKRGFALVVTLSLMVLLSILVS